MPRTQEKTRKKARPGRNDPCWCGSGKKYKDCHLAAEDTIRGEQRKLRNAQDTLLPKIMEAAESMSNAIPAALELFWHGRYTPEQMAELDDLEDRGADRFLTWFAFDHHLEDGHTLVQTLATAADEGRFEADEYEQQLLHQWASVRMRPYLTEEVRKGKGLLLRDLLDDQLCMVEEHAASRRVEQGEVLVGHLVPVGQVPQEPPTLAADGAADTEPAPVMTTQLYYVTGAVAQLTGDTRDKIVEFAHLHLEDLHRTHPEATLNDLPRERSHVFNHFVMELPEEHTPGLLDDVLLRTRTALNVAGIGMPGTPRADEPQAEPEAEQD